MTDFNLPEYLGNCQRDGLGMVWHMESKVDQKDIWPSVPFGYNQELTMRLNIYTGEILDMKKHKIGNVPEESLKKLHDLPDFKRFTEKAKGYQDYLAKTPEDWKKDEEALIHLIRNEDYNLSDVICEAYCEPESRSVVFRANGEISFQ